MPTPVKDQSGTNTSTGGTTTTISVTSGANSVVIVGACVGSTSTATIPTLSIAGAGLTWHAAPPGSGIGSANFRMATQLFWAYTASAFTAQTVTITSSLTIDCAATGYETFTGANSVSPVDPNALSTFGSFGAGTTGTITTTNANDVCLVVIGSNYNTGPATPVGTGVRDLNIVGMNGLFAYFALGRWPYTSTQTGATVGFTGVGAAGGLSAVTLTGDPTVTDARVTQALAEHWLTTSPDARITQVVAEHWASVTSDNLQAVVTQVVLEHWASVASVVPAAGGPMVTIIQ